MDWPQSRHMFLAETSFNCVCVCVCVREREREGEKRVYN